MPTDLAEDSLDLTIELLEAVNEPVGPFPRLTRTGRKELRQFRTVVLENPLLQVILLPDLGGRIIRILDKRTDTDILPFSPTISVEEGGKRGVFAPAGLQISYDGGERLNSMGTVVCQPDYSGEDEEPGGVWIGELCGNGLGLHYRIALPPDRAEILLECRLLNRTFEPLPVSPGLLGDTSKLYVEADLPSFDLAPRQLHAWTGTLTPISLGETKGQSREAAAYFDAKTLRIQTTEQRLGHKIVLLTEAGQTLEMPVDLYPEIVFETSLAGLPSPAKALAILDPAKQEILRIEGPQTASETRTTAQIQTEWPEPGWDEPRLRAATLNVAQRHLAHLLLGYLRLKERDFQAANEEFEQALLFNAEDHLTWWIKAVTERLLGNAEEERPELLNAHYLAPLEPALRAEGYLSSPSHAKEPSAVLRPLEETPDAFVEIACLLLEANLPDEATKWMDEALRHADLPMLRYLQAYAYLEGSRMSVEAADQVAMARRKPMTPPYPWRAIERRAMAALTERFPEA